MVVESRTCMAMGKSLHSRNATNPSLGTVMAVSQENPDYKVKLATLEQYEVKTSVLMLSLE